MGAIFEELLVSKIFDNREFGFAKMVVERPLRLNFQASPERIERLREEKAFQALALAKHPFPHAFARLYGCGYGARCPPL